MNQNDLLFSSHFITGLLRIITLAQGWSDDRLRMTLKWKEWSYIGIGLSFLPHLTPSPPRLSSTFLCEFPLSTTLVSLNCLGEALRFLSHFDPESRGATSGEVFFFFSIPYKLECGARTLLKILCTNLLKEGKAKNIQINSKEDLEHQMPSAHSSAKYEGWGIRKMDFLFSESLESGSHGCVSITVTKILLCGILSIRICV